MDNFAGPLDCDKNEGIDTTLIYTYPTNLRILQTTLFNWTEQTWGGWMVDKFSSHINLLTSWE